MKEFIITLIQLAITAFVIIFIAGIIIIPLGYGGHGKITEAIWFTIIHTIIILGIIFLLFKLLKKLY